MEGAAAAPESSPYLASAAAFVVVGLIVAAAGLAYAQFAYLTVLECDRAADSCVLAEDKPYWRDELDRFPVSKVQGAKHFEQTYKGRVTNCVGLTVAIRQGPVEICGRAMPELAASVNAFLADPARPRFAATIDNSFGGRMFAWTLLGCAAFPALFGLWLWPRGREAL